MSEGPIPSGKARYDCECGNIHYGSATARYIPCPRCGATLKSDRPVKTGGGSLGSRVKPAFYGDDL